MYPTVKHHLSVSNIGKIKISSEDKMWWSLLFAEKAHICLYLHGYANPHALVIWKTPR